MMMRQGNGGPNKRGRGRGNGGGGPPSNGGGNHNRRPNNGMPNRMQTFDSNGPEVRIRGNAYQVHEKYLTLARDAHAAGDRIMAENFYQHAEHYYRIINAEGYSPEDQRRQRPPEGYQQEQQAMQAPIPGEEPQPDLGLPRRYQPEPQQQQQQQRQHQNQHQNQQQQQNQGNQAPQGNEEYGDGDEGRGDEFDDAMDHQPG